MIKNTQVQIFIDQILMFPISLKQTMKGQIGPNKIRMEHFNTTVSSLGRFFTVKTTTKKKTHRYIRYII